LLYLLNHMCYFNKICRICGLNPLFGVKKYLLQFQRFFNFFLGDYLFWCTLYTSNISEERLINVYWKSIVGVAEGSSVGDVSATFKCVVRQLALTLHVIYHSGIIVQIAKASTTSCWKARGRRASLASSSVIGRMRNSVKLSDTSFSH